MRPSIGWESRKLSVYEKRWSSYHKYTKGRHCKRKAHGKGDGKIPQQQPCFQQQRVEHAEVCCVGIFFHIYMLSFLLLPLPLYFPSSNPLPLSIPVTYIHTRTLSPSLSLSLSFSLLVLSQLFLNNDASSKVLLRRPRRINASPTGAWRVVLQSSNRYSNVVSWCLAF